METKEKILTLKKYNYDTLETELTKDDIEEISHEELSEDERLLLEGYMNIIKESSKDTLTDAHTHLSPGLFEILEDNNLYIIVNGTNPKECETIKKYYKKESKIISSFGIHPWEADNITIKDMKPYLEDCDIIGEIGMDNVWCSVPLNIQEDIFKKQLGLAEKRGVPVILHTKGMEKEILQIIEKYNLKILVHWYSEVKYLKQYIDKGCYFSIGPDFENNPAVQNVIKEVDINKILIETDGIEAVKWALNKHVSINDIPDLLNNAIRYISSEKNINEQDVRNIINKNFKEFIKGDDIRRNY